MTGLDLLGADEIGLDWLQMAKGAAGALQGAGGLFSGSGGGGGGASQAAQQQALERQRMEEEKRRAEQSASRMKIALGVGGALAGGTILALVLRRK